MTTNKLLILNNLDRQGVWDALNHLQVECHYPSSPWYYVKVEPIEMQIGLQCWMAL